MNLRRFVLYALVLVGLAVIGLALTLWALFACAPPPLPGDELWTWRQSVGEALSLVTRFGSKTCFTADAAGTAALWIGTRTAGVLLVVLALMVLWETVGRELRRRWFQMRGGHLLLAGTGDDVAGLARLQPRFAGTVFLASDRTAAHDIGRRRPFAEIVALDARLLPRQLTRWGVGKAKLLAAATRNDRTNVAIAEAGLAASGDGELLVRLEQYSVRAYSSHRLRLRAAAQNRSLAVVSLTQLQTRRGMLAAMPGRYRLDGAERVHIAVCGTGPGLPAASFEIARQGFGLEREKPILSILRTGTNDFGPGALRRLEQGDAVELRVADATSAGADGLDRAIASVIDDDAPPLLAVHCVSDVAGEAEALALRWEEMLLSLGLPVPPIVAYGIDDHPLGSTGMIRVAAAQELADARAAAQLMDRRAMAVHRGFLDAQKAARGEAFGTAPAEAEWAALPESFQDDNRNVADQMDYKLASVFMLSRPGEGGAALDADEIEVLAGIAHARWMAAKAVTGWHYGVTRDDRRMLHPSMVPYASLDEPEKQKDRDEVASLPHMAALADEALLRERRIGVPRPLEAEALAALIENLRDTPKTTATVAVLPLDDADMVGLASALIEAGVLVEAVLDKWVDELRSGDAAPELANVLRRAWRIYVVRDGEARRVLTEEVTECVNETGALDAVA